MHVGFIETTKTEVMKFVFCTKAKSMFVEYVLPIRITLLLEKSESHDHGDLQIKPWSSQPLVRMQNTSHEDKLLP